MTCYNCWYCSVQRYPDGKKSTRMCINPKSEYVAKHVEKSFECSNFSDVDFPDEEAKKIGYSAEWILQLKKLRRVLT